MSSTDHTCRICRGEATSSQPLYHPCKCRGSIKYIHQDCLMEWLKHSNKSTEKCDICNSPYKFKIIYDPAMPQYIPLDLIWKKFLQITSSTVFKSISISLYILCIVIQVPLFWKFSGRVYTWAIDGTLPLVNQKFVDALLFGEFDINTYLADKLQTPLQLSLMKLKKFFGYTYFSGVRYLFVAIVANIALFIEREWVVRDEGYLKMLHKKIGKEHRAKLVDMLQNALQGLRTDGNNGDEAAAAANLQRLETLATAINDLQNEDRDMNVAARGEAALRRAIDQNQLFGNEQQPILNQFENGIGQHDVLPTHNFDAPENLMNGVFNGRNDIGSDDEEDEEQQEEEEDDEEAAVEEDVDVAAAAAAAAGAAGADGGVVGEFLEAFGVTLTLSTPIYLMFLCNCIVAVYLFLIYLIPHMLGNTIVSITTFLFKLINVTLISYISKHIPFPTYIYEFASLYITSLGTFNPNKGVTLIERIFILGLGYGLICTTIYRLMKFLVSGPKPISGTPRKAFKVLFEISSTAKVFLIFAIEIFFFPVYCGWLLDFCAAPLFVPQFIQTAENGGKVVTFLASSYFEMMQLPYLRVLLYWASGTLYMLFFALYIGMVRSTILRPGVLFFIRCPDDPNTRLIHDALVKPLSLQLSRIYLTAKVYSAFIIFGIGGVTWGLRYLVTPKDKDYNVFLPIQTPSYFTYLLLAIIVPTLVDSQATVTKYVRQYWERAFEISSHKLRLSHFIVGKPISSERGYVIYRNIWLQLFGLNVQPDYTQPVTRKEALAKFKQDPNAVAFFVPDGNYVRAPANDTISRKFVKKLFVAVSKDDRLLQEVKETPKRSGYETPTSDEDEDTTTTTTDDAYTIVYRPPNFKLRCFALILMLWIFAIIIILPVLLFAVVLGRPILRANLIIIDQLPHINIDELTNMDWRLTDLASIAIGLAVELQALIYYDKNFAADAPNNAGGNEIQQADPVRGMLLQGNLLNQAFNRLPAPVLYTLPSLMLWIMWILTVHKLCVDQPIRYMTGNLHVEFLLNFKTLLIHFLVSFWTILPALVYVTRRIPVEGQTAWQTLKRCGIIPCLLNFSMVHIPAFIVLYSLKVLDKANISVSFYIWPVLFICFALVKLITESAKLYTNINNQVKQEKYVKGRAIENVEDDD